jgi:hypothetical protein
MSDVGTYTPEQARLLWLDYLERKQLAPQVQRNLPQRRAIDEPSPHRVFVTNASDEEIPAYACMEIIGTEVVGGVTVVTVDKPSGINNEYLFNSQFAIAKDENGWAFRFGVIIMLGDPPSKPGIRYRPIVDSWEIEENDGPFVVFGEHNAAENALIGRYSDTGSHWEILAQIQTQSLKATDATATATYISVRQKPAGGCDPPDIDDGEVQFENPWRLDAHCGAKIILEYIDDRCLSGNGRWELRQVERYRARWIKFAFSAESPDNISVDAYWEGEDPEACGDTVTVEYPLGQPCVDSDVVACYDPFTFTYKAITSQSAMLGPAEEMDIIQYVKFTTCGLDYIKQTAKVFPCGSVPTLETTTPELVDLNVVTSASMSPYALNFTNATISVCAYIPIAATAIPITDCDPPPPCENYCRYEWLPNPAHDPDADPPDGLPPFSWQQTASCAAGCECVTESGDFPAPDPGDPLIKEFPCTPEP